jgi:hypothetical protein
MFNGGGAVDANGSCSATGVLAGLARITGLSTFRCIDIPIGGEDGALGEDGAPVPP